MMWNLLFMLLGAVVFGAGIAFEKLCAGEGNTEEENIPDGEYDAELFRQWGNLLDYDGTEQEDIYDEE